MILTDGRDISIDFTDAIGGFVFDQMESSEPNYHGIADMHRVDLIVDLADDILFVEVKDPQHPRAQEKGLKKFMDDLNKGTLGDTFAKKFMDSFVYRWAEDKVGKPIHYVSLVTLETALVVSLTDEVARKLPPKGKPVARWNRSFIENCQILNMETWNDVFPKWPVSRISAVPAPRGAT